MKRKILLFLLNLCVFYPDMEVEALLGRRLIRAFPDEFPYMVGFVVRPENVEKLENRQWCGGSLITRNIVLTAAHCFVSKESRRKKLIAVIGSVDLRKGKFFPIEWYVTFKQWAQENDVIFNGRENHDIAAVKLSYCVSENIRLAVISQKPITDFYDKIVQTAGWGATEGHLKRQYLLTASLRVLTRDECLENIRKYHRDTSPFVERRICTKTSPPVNLGRGDSGGPLVYNGKLIAINKSQFPSASNECPSDDVQNIHVTLAFYKDFIEDAKIREPQMTCCTHC